jgi:hypothetical protein
MRYMISLRSLRAKMSAISPIQVLPFCFYRLLVYASGRQICRGSKGESHLVNCGRKLPFVEEASALTVRNLTPHADADDTDQG